jgi:HlyD family secretion protein
MPLIKKPLLLCCLALFLGACAKADHPGMIYGSGTIETNEIDVSAKVVGRINYLGVKEGQQVTAGQVIARLDDLDKAAKDFARAEKLFQDKIIPADQFEVAQKVKENYLIASPITGTVILQELFQGEVVTPGTPIVTLADTNDLWVKIYIPEKDIGRVKNGSAAEVEVDSFPQEVFSGQVTYISDQAEFIPKNIQTKEERVNQVFAVKVQVVNKDQKLKIGMPADVYIKP